MCESCNDAEILESKCVNRPIKDDIALHKRNNSNNLSTTEIIYRPLTIFNQYHHHSS